MDVGDAERRVFLAAHPQKASDSDDDNLVVPLWTDQYSNLFQILSGGNWKVLAMSASQPTVVITGASTGIGAACALRIGSPRLSRSFAGVRSETAAEASAGQGVLAIDPDRDRRDRRGLHCRCGGSNWSPTLVGSRRALGTGEQRRRLRSGPRGTDPHRGVAPAVRSEHDRRRLRSPRRSCRCCGTSAGRIVNMSSVSGGQSTPYLGAYCASKFALGGDHRRPAD